MRFIAVRKKDGGVAFINPRFIGAVNALKDGSELVLMLPGAPAKTIQVRAPAESVTSRLQDAMLDSPFFGVSGAKAPWRQQG